MKDQINTIRAALNKAIDTSYSETTIIEFKQALTALAQLEAMVGSQEPVAWCPALTYPGHEKDRAWANGKPRKEDIEYWTLNGKGITYAYAAPVAQQYEAGDVASAAAQGFRDGVASVAQQPQARPDFTDEWIGYLKDGETPFERFLRERKDLQSVLKLYQRVLEENERLKAQQPQADTCQMCGDKPHPGCNSEFQGDKACRFWPAPDSSYRDDNYWRGWNAAIRSQQPQAEPDIHEARGQIEFLDKKNNALLTAIHKVMARLADLLDEDQFKEIEDAISSAGVQPQAEWLIGNDAEDGAGNRQPQAEAVPTIYVSRGQLENLKPDPEDEAGTYLPVRKTPKGKFTHPLFAAPQQAEAVPAPEFNLNTSKGGRGYIEWFFGEVIQRHDFRRYIRDDLAADFACTLARWLRDGAIGWPKKQAEAVPSDVVRDAERYRWLFSSHTEAELAECDQKSLQPQHTKQDETLALLSGWYTTKEQADKAIDAAIAAQGEKP